MSSSKYPPTTILHHPQHGDLPLPPPITQQLFDSALTYKPDDDDLVVVSYPKTGTTWMLYLLHQLRGESSKFQDNEIFSDHYVFLEYRGSAATESCPKPRLIKTHLGFNYISNQPATKYVVIARHPKDTVVSLFYHTVGFMNAYHWQDGKFDDFFDLFMRGECIYGDYFKQVPLMWMESKSCSNVHFVLYEDLKTNFDSEVKQLAGFLGAQCKEKLLANNQSLLKAIKENSSIETMKANNDKFTPEKIARLEHLPFTRKGIIGDWRNIMSEEQSEAIDKRLQNTEQQFPGFHQLWSDYKHLF